MVELYVRIVEHEGFDEWDDETKKKTLSRAGNLISTRPDGWPWKRKYIDSKEHIIIKVPGVRSSDIEHYYSPHPDIAKEEDDLVIRPVRMNILNLDRLALVVGAENLPDGKTRPESYVTVNFAELEIIKEVTLTADATKRSLAASGGV